MRKVFGALTCGLVLSIAVAGVGATPSVAQTTTAATTDATPPAHTRHRRHHVLHSGIGSAESRNVGPSSSVAGAGRDLTTGAQSGVPTTPGAPSAGSVTGGGGK